MLLIYFNIKVYIFKISTKLNKILPNFPEILTMYYKEI